MLRFCSPSFCYSTNALKIPIFLPQSCILNLFLSSDSVVNKLQLKRKHEANRSVNIEKLEFATPRATLNNIIAMVDKELKNPGKNMVLSFRPQGGKSISSWSSTCHMHWPVAASFSASAQTKTEAARLVSIKVLQWLSLQGKLRNMKPVFVDKSDLKALKKQRIKIMLNDEDYMRVGRLLSIYNETIKCKIDNALDSPIVWTDADNDAEVQAVSESSLIRNRHIRNNFLREKALEQSHNPNLRDINAIRLQLPIFQYRQNILDAVQKNRVVVIKGEPGCGKSTQVPQFILEEAAISGQACECNIIVTQPRRISAISLAERVAAERGEEVGDVVGYQVRFKSRLPRPSGAGIRFCSSGILLRILQSNPTLQGFSHIILDEAHERDVNTDMLMLLLKRVLGSNQSIKLVVMSATINPEIFQKYYSTAATLAIPGFTFPVQSHFLGQIKGVNLRQTQNNLEQSSPRLFYEEIASLIHSISSNKPAGAILCFLPGWQDIKQVSKYLERVLDPQACCVFPLHSRLSFDDQTKVFSRVPPGICKIILSTNVAETSVTIDDVSYVIDTGIHKEERLSSDNVTSVLDNSWISQANVIQRKGRAGRVGPGECFHLYTVDKFNSFSKYSIPELHRIPLQKIVLDIKAYNEEEGAAAFLMEMPEPPCDEAVVNAVDELVELGALNDDETLTPLGRRISKFTTHPKLSKALVYASILCCVDPVLTICSILSTEADIFNNSLEDRPAIVEIKKEFNLCSDHLALLNIFNEWIQIYADKDFDKEELFLIKNMLRKTTLKHTYRVRRQLFDQLVESKMLTNVGSPGQTSFSESDLPVSQEFIKALLYSGFSGHIFRRLWDVKNGRIRLNAPSLITQGGSKAVLMSDSVCHKSQVPSPFMTYFRSQQSVARRAVVVRDASVISPLSLLIFNSSNFTEWERTYCQPGVDDGIDFLTVEESKKSSYSIHTSRRDAEAIVNIKTMLNKIIAYYLHVEGLTERNENQSIDLFKEELVIFLSELLNKTEHHLIPTDINKIQVTS